MVGYKRYIFAIIVAPLSIVPLILIVTLLMSPNIFLDFNNNKWFYVGILSTLCIMGVIIAGLGLLLIGMPLYYLLKHYKVLRLRYLLSLAAIVGYFIGRMIFFEENNGIFHMLCSISAILVAYTYSVCMREKP